MANKAVLLVKSGIVLAAFCVACVDLPVTFLTAQHATQRSIADSLGARGLVRPNTTASRSIGNVSAITGATLIIGFAVALRGSFAAAEHVARNRRGFARYSGTETEAPPPPPPPFNPAQQAGALAPLGFFDPLGFSKVGDDRGFQKLRAAELKHGRVAMLATVGAVGQHFISFPTFEKVSKGVGALQQPRGILGMFFIFVVCGILEKAWDKDSWEPAPGTEGGNFGDPLGLNMDSLDMRNKELGNSRFAMVSILGILAAEITTGKDAAQQLGF